MKLLLALSILLSSLTLMASTPPPKEYTMEMKEEPTKVKRQIRLQLDIAEEDIKEYGIQQGVMAEEIKTRLSLAQIEVKEDSNLPKLVLRVKSIQADRAVATFVQFGFFEEATLTRNQNGIFAQTWSQATLISGDKHELVKEVTQVVIAMCNSFILEYNKAF